MKRVGNLYKKIIDEDNIRLAIKNAAKGKTNRKVVNKVRNNIEYYVKDIKKILLSGNYEPRPYIQKHIFDGARHKERTINKPAFYPDQVIHWCLLQVIEPIIMRGAYKWTCASIKDRGLLYCQKYVEKAIRKKYKYYVKLDIKKFYPSIDKTILKNKFRKIIKDNDTLKLLDIIVDSYKDRGVPIGNYTSQFFANYYLQDFDHFIKEKLNIRHYVRYMDDLLLFGNNKRKLRRQIVEITNFLKDIKLEIKEDRTLAKITDKPFTYCGRKFYKDHTTIKSSTFLRIRRRLTRVYKKRYISLNDARAIISYYGILKHTNSFNFTIKYVFSIGLKKCKEVIRNESRKQYQAI